MTDVLVLCYHAVSDRWQSSLAISRECLERQVGQILKRGYRGTTFTEAVCSPPAPRTLAVTFDDAFRSTLLAAPILADLGIPATVFAPAGFVGARGPMSWSGIERWSDGEHGDELTCMTWDELSRLDEDGWEIGSHTVSHAALPELEDKELMRELVASRSEIDDRIGRQCRSIAYPYGLFDRRVIDATRAAGYRAGCTLTRWPHKAEALAWPRVGSYETRGWLFRLKTLPGPRRLGRFVPQRWRPY